MLLRPPGVNAATRSVAEVIRRSGRATEEDKTHARRVVAAWRQPHLHQHNPQRCHDRLLKEVQTCLDEGGGVATYTAAFKLFGKWGRMDAVLRLERKMLAAHIRHDVTSLSAIIAGFARRGDVLSAERYYTAAQRITHEHTGDHRTPYLLSLMLLAYLKNNDPSSARQFYASSVELTRPHAISLRVINMAVRASPDIASAEAFLERECKTHGRTPDEHSFKSLLHVCEGVVEGGGDVAKAVEGVRRVMEGVFEEGLVLNDEALMVAAVVLCEGGAVGEGLELCRKVGGSGGGGGGGSAVRTIAVSTALIRCCVASGDVDLIPFAEAVFAAHPHPPYLVLKQMKRLYASHGRQEDAEKMTKTLWSLYKIVG